MTKKKAPLSNGNSGQAMLEFIVAMIFVLSFLIFFIQSSLFMAFGNYAQYATFMAARAYLSGGDSDSDQVRRAEDVLSKMLLTRDGQERFGVIAHGVDPGFPGNTNVPGSFVGDAATNGVTKDTDALNWMRGVRYRFKGRLIRLPFSGANDVVASPGGGEPTGGSEVVLTSESWLGRDPSAQSCQQYMQANYPGAVEDNGC